MSLSDSYRLVTLGRLALVAPDGSEDQSLHKRRRKLAVLAMLAVERRPLSRDVLVATFWGDQAEDRARHSLSDALSHLRRILGRDSISLSSTEVALAPGVVRVDALELAAAASARDHARVVETYAGPFLEGVYISDAPAFEQWVARQRRRTEDLFLQSAAQECAQLARARRWNECGEVAERWLHVAPLSSDAALYRLNALKAPGTREADARALEEYEDLRARLRRDYESEPDRAVNELAASIAERLTRTAREAPAPPPVAPAAVPSSPAPAVVSRPGPAVLPPALPAAGAPRRRALRRQALAWTLAAASVVFAVVVMSLISRQGTAATSPSVVAVLPFGVRGGADVAYLGNGMADLLSTTLDGAGSIRSVDPRAVLGLVRREGAGDIDLDDGRRLGQQLGAGLVVLGDVVASGSRVRIAAALYDQKRGDTPLARGSVEGPVSEIFSLVDQLTRQLLAGSPDRAADQLVDLAARTTASLPALKSYLDGVTRYRQANYHEAVAAFERAAAHDSTFALAHYQLSNALLWSAESGWDSVLNTAGRALRHSDRLNRRARLLVDAYHAFRAGELDRAEHLYRQTVSGYPDDVEAWYQLGDVLFHGNPPRGRSLAESREAFERVLAAEPEHRGALIHLMRVAMLEGRNDEGRALLERAARLTQSGDQPELDALRAAIEGNEAEGQRALQALRRAGDEVVRVTAMRVAIFAGDVPGAERISRLLVSPTRAQEFRVVGRLQLADLAAARGRRRAALAQLDSAAREAPPAVAPEIVLEYRALHLAFPFLPSDSAELRAIRGRLATMPEPPPTRFPMLAIYNGLHGRLGQYFLGLTALRLGDTATTLRHADAMGTFGGQLEERAFSVKLAASLRAHVAARRGDHAAAVATLDRGSGALSEGLLDGPVGDQALERWLRAESLAAEGRDAEALAWYASLGQTAMHQVVYLAPAALRMAAIEERRGNVAEAVRLYRRAIDLWRDCDPELRPAVDDARRRLAALER